MTCKSRELCIIEAQALDGTVVRSTHLMAMFRRRVVVQYVLSFFSMSVDLSLTDCIACLARRLVSALE